MGRGDFFADEKCNMKKDFTFRSFRYSSIYRPRFKRTEYIRWRVGYRNFWERMKKEDWEEKYKQHEKFLFILEKATL